MTKKNMNSIIDSLFATYPEPKCALDFEDPLQLLVSSRLSAQCTDARVNIVTKDLFKKYKTVDDYADADIKELSKMIYSCGFYNSKAKDIIAAAKMLREMDKFPDNIDDMLKIPGVGRKIANLMMGELYGDPSVVIADTHCIRLSNRLGFVNSKNATIVERELRKQLPKDTGFRFSHSLVLHGRAVCKAAKPNCENCCVADYCKEYSELIKLKKQSKTIKNLHN